MPIETPYGVRVWSKRERGIPTDAVYVGRPSKWGNPYKIGDRRGEVTLDRTLAIGQFVDWFLYSDQGVALHDQLGELVGKDLVCWCAPQDCHAVQLARFANQGFGIELLP